MITTPRPKFWKPIYLQLRDEFFFKTIYFIKKVNTYLIFSFNLKLPPTFSNKYI